MQLSAHPPSKLPGLACLGGAAISLVFLWWIAADSIQSSRSIDWPETQANVVRSEVRVGQGRSSGRFFPEIEYRYKVAGELYYGTRITFGEDPSFTSAVDAAALLARFPVFGTVSARYNPSSPNVSVLLPGQLQPDFKARAFPFGAGFVFWFFLGLGLLRRTFNHSLQRTASPSAELTR